MERQLSVVATDTVSYDGLVRRVAGLVLVAACGRVDFDALHDAGAAIDDGATGSDTSMLTDCEAHAGALLCEDFEAGLGRWPTQMGTTNLVTSPVYAGTGALASSIQVYPQIAYIGMDMPALASETSLHVRARVFVPSASSVGHINLINLDASATEGVSIYLTATEIAVYRSTPEQGSVTAPLLARDQWLCVELALGVADTAGTIELRVADQVVANGSGFDTRPTGGFSAVKVGIPYSSTLQSGPVDVDLDNIVVDVTPIGCTP